jgi:hypothetical protein
LCRRPPFGPDFHQQPTYAVWTRRKTEAHSNPECQDTSVPSSRYRQILLCPVFPYRGEPFWPPSSSSGQTRAPTHVRNASHRIPFRHRQPAVDRTCPQQWGGNMQHSSRGARRVGRQPRPGGVRRATQQPGSFGGSIGRCGAPSSAATHSADDAHAILSSWWGRARARAIGGGFESISLAASSRARRRRHPVRAHVTQVRPFPPLRIATYGGEATRRPWPKT